MAHNEIEPGDKINGFNLITPCNSTCAARVAKTIASGYPDAIHRRYINIIANGPSARDVDLWSLRGPTLALNGSMQLFIEAGLEPTAWACCDPQEIVASFLPENPPLGTTYFVASKCHQAVFDKLKGRDVRLWHMQDYPALGRRHTPLCPTVTLSATWLFYSLGYTDFEYWGWDGCFINGRDHAAHNANLEVGLHLNYGGAIKDGKVIGGKNFATTRSWAAEAKSAEQFFQLAKYFDIGVTLHGNGMFKAVQEFVINEPESKPQ